MIVGKVELPGNVLLSPLCGVTDSPFRRIARRNGAAMVFCEMTSSDGLVRKNPKTFELLEYRPEERPIGAQLCGSDPGVMAEAARMCEGLGFDTLDLNYGCPVRKVIAREAGAAMLTDLERRERVATAIGHLHDLAAKKGDYAAVLMRKHVAWYVRGLYDNSSLCRQVNHAATPAEVESLLLEYLERLESAPEPQIPVSDASPDAGCNGEGVDAHGSCAAS